MTATVQLLPSKHAFVVEGNDSILESALKAGLALNYGCSNGNCGLCRARIIKGEVERVSHHDHALPEAEQLQGYTLMCSYTAKSDLVLEADEASGVDDIPRQRIKARVKRAEPLSEAVNLLHLQTPRTKRLRFLAGQRVELDNGSEHVSFPLASCPCDDRNLQFHIPNHYQSFKDMKPMGIVTVDGPAGSLVLDETSDRDLIFIAYDLGFAPIKSLIEHAMSLETAETMRLYWYASARGYHYLQNLCRSWSDALEYFHYTPISAAAGQSPEDVFQRVLDDGINLKAVDIYVAGPPLFLAAAERLIEAGLSREQFYTEITA